MNFNTEEFIKIRKNYKFKFIDLFAGIGGIRLGFQYHGGYCVFSSENDKFAQKTYELNFGEKPYGDICEIPKKKIPDHDILLAGFPCQPFSQAGLKKGFSDPRGTMFFQIHRILACKKPKAFLLENVKQLKGHDNGKTLKIILQSLSELNYETCWKILNAKSYGLPQNRERIYIVGFDRSRFPKGYNFDEKFLFPLATGKKTKLGDVLFENHQVQTKYTLSEKLWLGHLRRKEEHNKKGNGFGFCLFNKESLYTSTLSARYYKDGSEILIDQKDLKKNPRKLTPRECGRLQGFPEEFMIPVSDMQAYKQFGNSVAVPVIQKIAENIIQTLENSF